MKRSIRAICALVSISAFALGSQQSSAPKAALDQITADELKRHILQLASDEFEGRAPGTEGEKRTIDYLTKEFKEIGLAPGNTDGTYTQRVPLVGITANKDAKLELEVKGKKMSLGFGDDFVAWTKRVKERESLDAEMVFVGYGVVAPEYNWDDYKNVDVRGKVIVMLINDPPIPDPSDASKLDPKMFGGRAMTYYGRWTYKYEIAAAKGAAGALIVHETEPASYGWDVVKNSNSQEQFDLVAKDNNMSRVAVEGWMTLDRTRELMTAAGQDFDALKRAAIRRDFKPVPLGARARVSLVNQIRRIESNNFLARLEGSDPALKNEHVVYMGHWDHLGVGFANDKGDRIYNGAVDNASGIAGLLALAKAFKALPTPPRRSILFLAVTAEEKGLIGSKHYAENPVYPLDKTVAALNMDTLNLWGRTKDMVVVGLGASTLDDALAEAAKEQGRTLTADPAPERGSYYRSDHFNFAKQGVPALYSDSGSVFVGKPEGYGKKVNDEYNRNDYHKPSDEVKADWDYSGAVEDMQLLFTVGYRLANTDKYPEWKPGNEFKARRDAMMKKSKSRR
ncbi:MAG TPA: M28 family metallopeptidase [Blastocatellia bacterium]|nr:M28 family metallopeptidase [Blastocatellia bacterium]